MAARSIGTRATALSLTILFFILQADAQQPTPTPWPEQFHSVLYMNSTGKLQIVDLWYDWPKGRNFNIIQNQLGKLLYDLEWTNGTSFYYTLDANKECRTMHFEVGILPPNWLHGANYLGQERVDGFLCNVWEKVDFIWYYEDVVTKRPVHWLFFTGMSAHVMTFEVGAVLEDEAWQAPVYCFDNEKEITGGGADMVSAVDAVSVKNLAQKSGFKGLLSSSVL
ncbi:Uncharacterized protein EJ110_NYTH30904 [Nymphaea thermarum]|nr:Uncharacterized protein EJ110_NYTH30904 [Nymphaea thermarum]